MESALKIWAVILALGAINYLTRLSFIAFFAQRAMPPLLVRALKYVPAAMLTALVLPMIVEVHDGAPDFASPKVFAALIAVVVALVTRSTLGTLVAGMAALWLIKWLWA